MRAPIAQDREAFYSAEIAVREKTGYLPFGRLGFSADFRRRQARHRGACPQDRRGLADPRSGARARPAEAPLAVVRGRHQACLLAKAPRGFPDLSAYLREWLAAAPKAKGTLLEVDVDPQSFFS